MSRWVTEFTQHPFQVIWNTLKGELALVEVDDQTVPTSLDELARLKRVVVYLDEMIASIDPDITPKSVWANFQPQADSCLQQIRFYVSNKQISHIIQANEHADNLLTYLKPYFIFPTEVIKALQNSAKKYVSEVENYVETFRNKSALIIKTLENNESLSGDYLSQTESNKTKIYEFANSIFVGTAETDSFEKTINKIKSDIDLKAEEIMTLHTKLLVGDASIQTAVTEAEKEISERKDKISGWINTASGQIKELGIFHTKIFGEKDKATGNLVNGLQLELDQRTSQLSKLEIEQSSKQKVLFEKIESLLPGATSAGLASSYGALKLQFNKPIILYTKLFYGSLLLLVVAAIIMSVRHVSIYPVLSLDFVEVADWDYVLRALLYKVPFIAPVLWLAVFSSTRRSQYERLQQEYAHKEAFASSYESYKKQLKDLNGDSDDLQKELISKAIEAISYNASVTLDGKHEDKLPIHNILEALRLERKQ